MEKKERLGQEPAFVQPFCKDDEGNFHTPRERSMIDAGMSKRFYAACAAMQGILASGVKVGGESIITPEIVIPYAYQFADELLKQENNE